MKDFKPASTLNEEYGRKPRPPSRGKVTPSFRKSKTHKCEHYNQGICEPSKEAVRLGLREAAFPCTGDIPPVCYAVQHRLEAGETIMEIYQK